LACNDKSDSGHNKSSMSLTLRFMWCILFIICLTKSAPVETRCGENFLYLGSRYALLHRVMFCDKNLDYGLIFLLMICMVLVIHLLNNVYYALCSLHLHLYCLHLQLLSTSLLHSQITLVCVFTYRMITVIISTLLKLSF
jgi:hypothetical protein